MVPGDKARLMEKVKCSLSSLIQIALQEVPSLPELVCWFCEEPAKTYLTFSFDLLVPRTCAFTANMMGQESLTFYPPNSATGKKTNCVGESGRMRCWGCLVGSRGTSLSVTYCIPAQPGPSRTQHATPHFRGVWRTADVLICRPLLVLFPLLGMPFCITELFQGPGQRLAVLWTLDPLVFCSSNYFKYPCLFLPWVTMNLSIPLASPEKSVYLCPYVTLEKGVRASNTFSKRSCDSKKD